MGNWVTPPPVTFDPELGECGQHRRRTHQANDLASPPLRKIIHVSWSFHHRFSSITGGGRFV
jgi:hypothetical protein